MTGKRKQLTPAERDSIVAFILMRTTDGEINYGAIGAAAAKFRVHRNTIHTIWKRRNETATESNMLGDVSNRQKGNTGTTKKYDDDVLKARLLRIPINNRQTIRSIATSLKVSNGKICSLLSSGVLRRVNTRMKPCLTFKHRIDRLEFAISKIDSYSLKFDEMYDIVMIDEKSFYQNTDKKKYYIADDELEPRRSCANKRHIESTMFISAVAKPRCVFLYVLP
jgi:hypothetical protein